MPRKMTIHLTCGSIGVKAGQREAIEYAHAHGYEAVEPQPDFLASLSDSEAARLNDEVRAKGLVWGSAGLRADFRQTEELFGQGMAELPGHARALKRAGVTRVGTWVRPSHQALTYRMNFEQHAKRLGAVADVLGDHGIRLGLEYIGPKTLWASQRYPFVHTMAEMKEFIAATGRRNIGFVLDSWHWYTAQETRDDLMTLKNSDIVSVDLNDAPRGTPVDQQIDSVRELPMATGVIDAAGFLNALQSVGYDGPVRAEPFNAELRKLPPQQALAVTMEAMRKAFGLIRV